MVDIELVPHFQKVLSKTDFALREKILKQIDKLRNNPETGKPMKHSRRGTRELYIKPFRLSYAYIKEENKILLLDIYHKDEQ
ncbi:MAG: type II toxin-antitoxin system RelE/ParE family toxin [archaeon]